MRTLVRVSWLAWLLVGCGPSDAGGSTPPCPATQPAGGPCERARQTCHYEPGFCVDDPARPRVRAICTDTGAGLSWVSSENLCYMYADFFGDSGVRVDGGIVGRPDTGPGGLLAVGAPGCTLDSQCISAVCWSYADVDPLCTGTICSLRCTTDMECVDAALAAGADFLLATSASCEAAECDLSLTGLGAFTCG